MSQKLGEVLIGQGLLSRTQLEHALELQLIFGGHLGTCLLELGYVDELRLGRALAAIHEVKCARPEMFEDIPRDVLDSVPADEVRRRRIVPFGSTDRALHVAAVHPSHLVGVAALARRRVVSYVAPEICIVAALERYYGIPRRRRYLSVPYASIAPRKAQTVLAAPVRELPSPARPSARPASGLARRLSRVENHAELGEALLDFAAERTERSILFEVNAAQARPVNWRGGALDRTRFESFCLALSPHSVLGLAGDEPLFRGPLPLAIDCRGFHGALGIPTPREVVVLPLYGDSRLEAVLYGDGERIGGSHETWLSLLDQVGLALRMLDYKLRLCSGA